MRVPSPPAGVARLFGADLEIRKAKRAGTPEAARDSVWNAPGKRCAQFDGLTFAWCCMRGKILALLQPGESAGGERGGDHDPFAVPAHLGGFEQFLEGVIGEVLSEGLGEAAGERDEVVQSGGLAGGFVFAGGDLFDLHAQRAQRAGHGKRRRHAGDDGRVGLEGQREAEDVDSTALR